MSKNSKLEILNPKQIPACRQARQKFQTQNSKCFEV